MPQIKYSKLIIPREKQLLIDKKEKKKRGKYHDKFSFGFCYIFSLS